VSNPWGQAPQGRPRGQGPNPRTLIWIIVAVVVLALLLRSHHLSTFAVYLVLALVPSVVLHELAHGLAAQALGDDTPRQRGRLTLNPVPAIDPYGTVVIPILLALTTLGVIGWAKPMPYNRSRLRGRALLVTMAGPATNIVLAVGLAFAYRFLIPVSDKIGFGVPLPGAAWTQFIFVAGYVNFTLAIMNLIPLPPLDGSALVDRMLPPDAIVRYHRIAPYAMYIPLIILIIYPEGYNRIFTWLINDWASIVGI
jgi:Zn-dependent protease